MSKRAAEVPRVFFPIKERGKAHGNHIACRRRGHDSGDCTDLRRKHGITGFDDHQTEHDEDQAAHDLTAALERHIGTHLITADGADQRRDAHGEEHLSMNEVDDERRDVGREVYHLGAARRGQERDAEYRGKGQNQEGSGARTDQSIVSADKQADEEGLYGDITAERC